MLRRVRAQTGAELSMTLRRGESLLLTIGIPVLLLVFFSAVHLLPTGTPHPVDFLAPGVLALAVMGTAMVNLSIQTGFERGYGVLKRLGSTPLGRPEMLASKIIAILAVEALQVAVLVPVAVGLGWHPSGATLPQAVAAIVLATLAFGGIGLAMAGRAAGRGEPRSSERPVPTAATRERDARPFVQAPGMAGRYRPGAAGGSARRLASPRAVGRAGGERVGLGGARVLGGRRAALAAADVPLGMSRRTDER